MYRFGIYIFFLYRRRCMNVSGKQFTSYQIILCLFAVYLFTLWLFRHFSHPNRFVLQVEWFSIVCYFY